MLHSGKDHVLKIQVRLSSKVLDLSVRGRVRTAWLSGGGVVIANCIYPDLQTGRGSKGRKEDWLERWKKCSVAAEDGTNTRKVAGKTFAVKEISNPTLCIGATGKLPEGRTPQIHQRTLACKMCEFIWKRLWTKLSAAPQQVPRLPKASFPIFSHEDKQKLLSCISNREMQE